MILREEEEGGRVMVPRMKNECSKGLNGDQLVNSFSTLTNLNVNHSHSHA